MEIDAHPGDRVAAVASLDQPLRRRLHELLSERRGWITRDEAAHALNVARSVAAFHLDKLADAGVVDVGFERMGGRSGPGAGRPSKVYRLVADELSASVPDRRYELAGQLLADAVAEASATGAPVDECVRRAARAAGVAVGAEARTSAEPDGASRSAVERIAGSLGRCGYAPCFTDDGEVALANCPFHRLAQAHRDLVCGMNLELIEGVLDGLELAGLADARLAPEHGYCCVRLRPH